MKRFFTLLGTLCVLGPITAQVGIKSTTFTPHPSAMLEVVDTMRGVLIPRMTTAQRNLIASPATSLLIFNTSTGAFNYYTGSIWIALAAGNLKELSDADNDTKVQVEATPDQDSIRFMAGGTEQLVLDGKRAHLVSPGQSLFIGKNAGLNDDGTTNQNVFIGYEAGKANSTGASNTFLGKSAGAANASSSDNTFLGYAAGILTTNSTNTFVGSQAGLANVGGSSNTFLGFSAGSGNVAGAFNTFLGANTGTNNNSGADNTFIGYNAGKVNTGNSNTLIGRGAGDVNASAANNTFLGKDAGGANTIGSGNTFFGMQAGDANVSGIGNTCIGNNADVSMNNFTNATSLGDSAVVNASHKVRIGDEDVMVIEGQVDWTFPSDARFKYDVSGCDVPGLDMIKKLTPVNYRFDNERFRKHITGERILTSVTSFDSGDQYPVQTGFLAQEVEQVCHELGYPFSGLHVPENETDNYGLAYASFVPVLVKGMQEQQQQIELLTQTVELMKAEMERLSGSK